MGDKNEIKTKNLTTIFSPFSVRQYRRLHEVFDGADDSRFSETLTGKHLQQSESGVAIHAFRSGSGHLHMFHNFSAYDGCNVSLILCY